MPRLLYTLFFYAIMPAVLLRLLLRGFRAPDYWRRIGERFGFVPRLQAPRVIWVHSVSVGETLASAPLVNALRERYPDYRFIITTMTPTGSARVRALYGDAVDHVYAPWDLPGAVARFLEHAHPALAIIVETEIWPNTLAGCAARNIPVVLVNARLSEKSARGYGRVRPLTREAIGNITKIVAQTDADAERFKGLGALNAQLAVTGNIKFDIDIPAMVREAAQTLRQPLGARVVWIGASTHRGEDEPIIAAHKALLAVQPDALLILVPRHPERFDDVARLIEQSGLRLQRRSDGAAIHADTQVLLGDTMGELLLMFGVASFAFVGGSLVDNGGHNMLEPAAWCLPVITGPSDFNFALISQLLIASGALVQIEDGRALTDVVLALAGDASLREERGRAARAVVDANRGALQRVIAEVAGLLSR